MRKCANISIYMRRPLVIFDFATAPLRIYLYMMKILFSYLSVYLIIEIVFVAIALLLHKKKFFCPACEEGQGICSQLLTLFSLLLIALTLPVSLFFVIKVVQVKGGKYTYIGQKRTLKMNKNIRSINADIWKVKKNILDHFFLNLKLMSFLFHPYVITEFRSPTTYANKCCGYNCNQLFY
jgi:hypothetical protein